MKNVISIVLLFACAMTYAQTPKHTNQIKLFTGKPKAENVTTTAQTLIDLGFEIEKVDKEFGLITTRPRDIKKNGGRFYLYISAKDSVVSVKGNMTTDIELSIGGATSTSSFTEIKNAGMKGSPIRKAFEEMESTALAIPHETITYIIN